MSLHNIDHTSHPRTPDQFVLAVGAPAVVFVLFCLIGAPSVSIRTRALSRLLAAIRPQVIDRASTWIADSGIPSPLREVIVTQMIWKRRNALAR